MVAKYKQLMPLIVEALHLFGGDPAEVTHPVAVHIGMILDYFLHGLGTRAQPAGDAKYPLKIFWHHPEMCAGASSVRTAIRKLEASGQIVCTNPYRTRGRMYQSEAQRLAVARIIAEATTRREDREDTAEACARWLKRQGVKHTMAAHSGSLYVSPESIHALYGVLLRMRREERLRVA